jgi:ubiquinone/menaquinone biosynthesis C-methylase UbiE
VSSTEEPSQGYVLGHTPNELDRLAVQAQLIEPITRGFFQDAGVAPGMRVLDVGSGAGDVTFLTAALVGPGGEVIGVDRSPTAVSAATDRAAAHSLENISFRVGDPAELTFGQPFDAAIGRYVLQFQTDPVTFLRGIAQHVRPGGSIVFHELDWSVGIRSLPPAPTFDRCCRWASETMRRSGVEIHMGLKLHATFVAAGLPAPTMRLEAMIGGGDHAAAPLRIIAGLARTLLPEAERLGVSEADGTDPDTLFDAMYDEVRANGSVVVGNLQLGAWSRR